MKSLLLKVVGASLVVCSASSLAQEVDTIAEYNKQLPYWGITWSPGAGNINGYHPTVYTGFAMRQENPERIHLRLSRGNQTRVSVILDENTLIDYTFDLVKRANVLNATKRINVHPSGAKILPQLKWFTSIIDSKEYGIREFVEKAESGGISKEEMYKKGLETLTALNPGRVFNLKIDLKSEFLKWKEQMKQPAQMSGESQTVVAIDTLVWGRVNLTSKPSDVLLAKLQKAQDLAINGTNEQEFIAAAVDLFKEATGDKYRIKVLENGKFVDAIRCSVSSCTLTYPEFTAIYPTGSVMEKTSDENGNSINSFATPGLWNFVSRGARNVDNIRDEPYYGWAPKMDYQAIGNGYHNPAVRFFAPSTAIKTALGAPLSHNTLWAVKRGGVSHGCSRVPLGHLWEMRQIFPVEDAKMQKLFYFGNNPRDFDVYDIDGDGKLEVMGVEYMISYNLKGTSGLSTREGADFTAVDAGKKTDFYTSLYGARNVFTIDGRGKYIFMNPTVSLQSYLDQSKSSVKTRLKMTGEFPLYEQEYEREKVQLYSSGGVNKVLHRIMGRIRGCAPISDKVACGEAAFDQEAKSVLGIPNGHSVAHSASRM
jgi:hypothetical protein